MKQMVAAALTIILLALAVFVAAVNLGWISP